LIVVLKKKKKKENSMIIFYTLYGRICTLKHLLLETKNEKKKKNNRKMKNKVRIQYNNEKYEIKNNNKFY